ncbi:hypothetical protein CP97_04670 [Aurantiacibacter atlanticus]|uniref:Uncharacterized protein n=1 Tax=Aurantiacibacter atlanticus TaxID=1648404 RepID=A0A0H4VAI4_9SPHN|nr:hypothetical protein [Aurantiacibacter atlanticus]AKQ41475.2 hypothetical protein CP97_04670 [Aurantiacibacter atlanticus]MDF1833252.1 hypothetical protein [Alteraurantiacibacter sp. bin_em_oilr2.035]
MMRAAGGNWLVPLADLSLILFIVTGGALNASLGRPEGAAPAEGVAAAIHVDVPGAPPLEEMLADHAISEGERLTVLGYYAQGDRTDVAQRAERLADEAIAAGIEPRVIVQPAAETLVIARFAHDADPGLARGLQVIEEE